MNILILTFSLLFLLSFQKEKYSQEYNNLYNYIISNGGYINPKLIPEEKSSINRYIITNSKVYSNEKLLFIPEKVLISKIHKSVFQKCLEAYGSQEDYDYDCLVYFMTIDKYNLSSNFKPYYDYLPLMNYSDFMIDLTPEEINRFNNTGIIKYINSYHKFYSKALNPVKDILKKFSEKNGINYNKILDDFKYNFFIVGSRNFGRPESYYDHSTMVPFLDLINHSDKNNSSWFYEDIYNGYTLIAGKDIEENTEITDLYGQYHNSYLYNNYGFVIKDNKYHEYVEVNICGEVYTFHEDYLNSTVNNIYDKIIKKKKCGINYVIKDLKKRKEYYINLKTDRYNLKVIIEEHIDIINKAINKILKL